MAQHGFRSGADESKVTDHWPLTTPHLLISLSFVPIEWGGGWLAHTFCQNWYAFVKTNQKLFTSSFSGPLCMRCVCAMSMLCERAEPQWNGKGVTRWTMDTFLHSIWYARKKMIYSLIYLSSMPQFRWCHWQSLHLFLCWAYIFMIVVWATPTTTTKNAVFNKNCHNENNQIWIGLLL